MVFLPLPQLSKLAPRVCLPPLAIHQRGSHRYGQHLTLFALLLAVGLLLLLPSVTLVPFPSCSCSPTIVSLVILFIPSLFSSSSFAACPHKRARSHAQRHPPLPIGLVSLIIPRPGAHELSLSLEGKPRQARLDLLPHPRIPALEACNLTKLPLFGPQPATSFNYYARLFVRPSNNSPPSASAFHIPLSSLPITPSHSLKFNPFSSINLALCTKQPSIRFSIFPQGHL